MIRITGEICLYIAACFALVQSILPLFGHIKKNIYASAFAKPCALAQWIFVGMSYSLLTLAFATNDFSIQYVAANSHASLPLIYRLTAVWGAHEGSILFWILILTSWSMILNVSNADNKNLTLSLLGLISFCFLCFLLLTSNPFLANHQAPMGQDLNPLLQDPGFVIHPPMLYIGYVGFSVAFAVTLAALICKKCDTKWTHTTKKFALAAWCFLTLGITLGSWWAYRVLGWGGFWFWDPVENASLLPWLAGTALIHVLVVCEKRGTAMRWAALLAIITFTLSLMGTFLVRSGLLISVHTFANDPTRGLFLLLVLGFMMIVALAIYVNRILHLPFAANASFSWLSREAALLLNSALLMIALTTILLGTLYPLILDAFHLTLISVGAPYFNTVMMPFIFILMFCMGIGVLLNWDTASPYLYKQLLKMGMLSIITAATLLWGVTGELNGIAILSLSLSCWVIFSLRKSFRFYPAMSLAHTGFAILVIGIMLSSALNQERELRMQPGDKTSLGPYQFLFASTKVIQGSNFKGIRAKFIVMKNNHYITTIPSQKRIYTVREMVMTKVGIHPSLFRDLYIALGQPLDDHYWSVRLYYKPFVRWIWFGGLIIVLGGIIAIWDRQRSCNP